MIESLFLKKRYQILSGLLLSLIIPQLFTLTSSPKLNIVAILFLPVLTLIIWKFELIIITLLASTFTKLALLDNYISVTVSILLMISFLLTFKSRSTSSIKNPILLPFYIWLISALPSVYNTPNFNELGNYANLAAMVIVTTIIYKHVNDYQTPFKVLFAYLIFSFLNGISVILQSYATGGDRVFGFAGVCYIDFSNIAILSLLCLMVFARSKTRTILILLIIFYFFTLILTQTRNSILSLAATLISLFFIILIYSKKIRVPKSITIKNSTIILLSTTILFIGMLFIFPSSADRFLELIGKKSTETDGSLVSNSLVSRMLIWHTSFNAFLKHPFIGIGLFSFSHQSYLYHTIPNFLYKEFVWYLTPHETFIALLAETGIIGFTGFIILISSIIRMSFKSLKNSISQEQIAASFTLLGLQLYIVFSMFVTDAWLWGQCGMQWAIITGFSMANYKLIYNNKHGIK